jgi:hypothetical protein
MARSKSLITACITLAAGAAIAGVATSLSPLPDPSAAAIQCALDDLDAGHYLDAERKAVEAATDVCSPAPRAWAIVAAARQRRGAHADAARAYRQLLASTTSPEIREFALEQMRACEKADAPAEAITIPSRRLTGEQLGRLSAVHDKTYAESSDHFIVQARNPDVAKLVVVEAENALGRICGSLLGGQSFPHSVQVNVWADRREFHANATDAAEWAGGGFRVTVKDGATMRQIDLTQHDGAGKFAVVMLDRVLPHEMCHLVLREFFGDAACPLFLNEGLAMMAEADADNSRIELAGNALAGKARPQLEELVVAERHDLQRPAVFYAESFSLLEFLHGRLDKREFRDFLKHVRGGSTLGEALQRALYTPRNDTFLAGLASAWEDHAVTQSQYLQALRGQKIAARN